MGFWEGKDVPPHVIAAGDQLEPHAQEMVDACMRDIFSAYRKQGELPPIAYLALELKQAIDNDGAMLGSVLFAYATALVRLTRLEYPETNQDLSALDFLPEEVSEEGKKGEEDCED